MSDTDGIVIDLLSCSLEEGLDYTDAWLVGYSAINDIMEPAIDKAVAKAERQSQETGEPAPELQTPKALHDAQQTVAYGTARLQEQKDLYNQKANIN